MSRSLSLDPQGVRMNTTSRFKSSLCVVAFAIACLFSMSCDAWVAHGGGGYYHGGGYGNYYRGGYGYYGNAWRAPGVVIGVPARAYYGSGCTLVQTCYPYGGCVNQRVCR